MSEFTSKSMYELWKWDNLEDQSRLDNWVPGVNNIILEQVIGWGWEYKDYERYWDLSQLKRYSEGFTKRPSMYGGKTFGKCIENWKNIHSWFDKMEMNDQCRREYCKELYFKRSICVPRYS